MINPVPALAYCFYLNVHCTVFKAVYFGSVRIKYVKIYLIWLMFPLFLIKMHVTHGALSSSS
jgi:hypothetical protein